MNLVMVATWVLVGLLVGWLAGFVIARGGSGWRGDLVLGLAGSLLGVGILWAPEVAPDAGTGAVAGVAFAGAAIVIILQRKIWPAIA